MPTSCSASGCTNRFKTGGLVQFFGFPFKNEDILKKWTVAIGRQNFVPTKASKLCSVHFKENDFLKRPGTYVKKLKPDAVPSVFPENVLRPLKRKFNDLFDKYELNPRSKISARKTEEIVEKRIQRTCCVPDCLYDRPPFHRIPSSVGLYLKWLKRIKNEELKKTPKSAVLEGCRVCDIHFSEDDKLTGNIRLTCQALPTLFLPGSEDSQGSSESEIPASDRGQFLEEHSYSLQREENEVISLEEAGSGDEDEPSAAGEVFSGRKMDNFIDSLKEEVSQIICKDEASSSHGYLLVVSRVLTPSKGREDNPVKEDISQSKNCQKNPVVASYLLLVSNGSEALEEGATS